MAHEWRSTYAIYTQRDRRPPIFGGSKRQSLIDHNLEDAPLLLRDLVSLINEARLPDGCLSEKCRGRGLDGILDLHVLVEEVQKQIVRFLIVTLYCIILEVASRSHEPVHLIRPPLNNILDLDSLLPLLHIFLWLILAWKHCERNRDTRSIVLKQEDTMVSNWLKHVLKESCYTSIYIPRRP